MKKKDKRVRQPDWPIVNDDGTYATTDVFVHQFSMALGEYLNDLFGDDKHHIVDYAVSTASFAEAFYHITNNF